MSDYRSRMMNIPCPPIPDSGPYALGHRNAWHAAAGIASEADAELDSLRRELAEAEREEMAKEALEQILSWAEAYPIECFPEPDWKRSDEVLKAAGLSLSRISASNMRHVITRVAEIARGALLAKPEVPRG
jgi:hypothetical protein